MKKLAIKIAFLCLILAISVPIFNMQLNIRNKKNESEKLAEQIEYAEDKLEYSKQKLERIKSGDEEVLKEYARDSLGYYDPEEEIIYNDISD